jgi:hypothetical protein
VTIAAPQTTIVAHSDEPATEAVEEKRQIHRPMSGNRSTGGALTPSRDSNNNAAGSNRGVALSATPPAAPMAVIHTTAGHHGHDMAASGVIAARVADAVGVPGQVHST